MTHSEPTEQDIQHIRDQAPVTVTEEDIRNAWREHNGDFVATISALWMPVEGIDKHAQSSKKAENKWDKIRSICDAYDTEMEHMVQEIKAKNQRA